MKNLTRIACIASMALAAFAAQAETYAVMIGICDYPDVLDAAGNIAKDKDGKVISNDLNGCVNDIKSYDELLVKKFGVKEANIKLLLDKDANKNGFIENMRWLLQTAKPGDQVMFFYSGHGTQYDSKEEADGKQEAIVLGDMTLVDGSFFHEVSQNLSKAGVNATFVFDSCFSGGMTRDAVKTLDGKEYFGRTRFVDKTRLGTKATVFPATQEAALKAIPHKKAAGQAAGSYAFVLAGGENQTTIDLDFKDGATPDHGLFSLIFTQLLDKMPDTPVEEMVKGINEFLKDKKFDQSPGFEFSTEARGQLPFFLKG